MFFGYRDCALSFRIRLRFLRFYGLLRYARQLGIHNTAEDADALLKAVAEIARTGGSLTYDPVPEHEAFEPRASSALATEETR